MIDDLKPYSRMKDSGVPWLGEVPEHWEVRPVGGMGSLFKGNGGNKGDEVPVGIPCVRYGDLYTRHEFFITKSKGYVSKERSGAYTPIRHGDVLFAASGETEEDIGRSSVNLIEGEARCGGDILVLRRWVPAVPRYLGYAADSPASRNQKACMGRGFTVVHIYGSQLKRLLLPLPPVPEQAAIVRFLDHADRRIRRYIRAKQKLIKLLEEQKRAIIHRAVTRGLDPDVRLKPSGVEWLGRVPEHWHMRRLKFVATDIVDCLHATPVYSDDGEYPAIRTADILAGRLLLDRARRVEERHYRLWTSRLVPTAGDVLYTREGERFGIAAVVPAGVSLCISQRMMVFRIAAAHNSLFVMWQINCRHVYAQAASDLIGSAAPHVNVERIKNFWLAIPPHSEQDAVADWIATAIRPAETAIVQAQRQVALLRDYRTRLIADVVTGKVDVREAAARLPEETMEPETADEERFDSSQELDEDAEPEEAVDAG
ncbi:MAG: restriction endonuclease subunit S [Thermoanaerobaculaceae bacterium]